MQYTQLFRQLRERKGLSHEALAKLAHCHRNTVLNVESGRQVRFKTMAELMGKMGYASDSPEMASLALLWLESVTGIDLADPSSLSATRKKVASYSRASRQAANDLLDTVRTAKLNDRDLRLLAFAAENRGVLSIIEEIQELLHAAPDEHVPELKVAEDK